MLHKFNEAFIFTREDRHKALQRLSAGLCVNQTECCLPSAFHQSSALQQFYSFTLVVYRDTRKIGQRNKGETKLL